VTAAAVKCPRATRQGGASHKAEGRPLATIHTQKIETVASLAAGATHHFQWNNPPWGTVLGYFAYPDPPAASGPHGTSQGTVEITKVTCTYQRDNYNGDKKYVKIDITNTGSSATGFDLYQSWIS
jgi:hypothetical protein